MIAILLAFGFVFALPDEHPVIFNNTNTEAVYNEPFNETWFLLDTECIITEVYTYHWNHGQGDTPTWIGIYDEGAKEMGKWNAKGMDASMGVENGNHYIQPNIKLDAGIYQIVDGSSGSWSWNNRSSGSGFAIIHTKKSTN